MTAITGTLKNSGNQLLTGELWVTLDAPLRDDETSPDSTLLPITNKFSIANGVLNITLPESATRNITYYFQFFEEVGGEISPVASMDFHAQVPPSVNPIEFADLIPTGISTDTQDTGALRIAQLLATVPEYVDALQGGPRYLGEYDAGTLYRKGDAAKFGGSWWMWTDIIPGSGIEPSAVPPGSDYWLDVGSKGDPGGTGGQDTAYGPGWDGATWAPTANVLYDIISTLLTSADAATTYAPLLNAILQGNPSRNTAPAFGNRSGQLATTAWVGSEFATLASPALSGNPSAPTQAASDVSNKIATTKFVDDYARDRNLGTLLIASRQSGSQALTIGNWTTVILPVETDPQARYNPSTGFFTVPTTGWWTVNFSGLVNSTGANIIEIHYAIWNMSTTSFIGSMSFISNVGGAVFSDSGSKDIVLQAGSNFAIRIFVSGPTTAALDSQHSSVLTPASLTIRKAEV